MKDFTFWAWIFVLTIMALVLITMDFLMLYEMGWIRLILGVPFTGMVYQFIKMYYPGISRLDKSKLPRGLNW